MAPLVLFLATFLHEISFLPLAGSSGLITVAHSEATATDAAPNTKSPILTADKAKVLNFMEFKNNRIPW